METRWVHHKNKRVLIAEYSGAGFNTETLKKQCQAVRDILKDEMPNSVLAISNVVGIVATPGNLNELKNILSFTRTYVIKRAVIGMKPSQVVFLDIFNKLAGRVLFSHFSTLEEALDWIVQD